MTGSVPDRGVTIKCLRDREGLWHIATAEGDSWFRPILCGEVGMGVIAPGPGYEREPTCPECVERVANA